MDFPTGKPIYIIVVTNMAIDRVENQLLSIVHAMIKNDNNTF